LGNESFEFDILVAVRPSTSDAANRSQEGGEERKAAKVRIDKAAVGERSAGAVKGEAGSRASNLASSACLGTRTKLLRSGPYLKVI
jgi:hypothetical protein